MSFPGRRHEDEFGKVTISESQTLPQFTPESSDRQTPLDFHLKTEFVSKVSRL